MTKYSIKPFELPKTVVFEVDADLYDSFDHRCSELGYTPNAMLHSLIKWFNNAKVEVITEVDGLC